MSATLQQLREEHQREFIGAELAALLTRIATATARTYPSSYTPAGVWNEDSDRRRRPGVGLQSV